MNEFLLLAVTIVYLAISHDGAPVTKIGDDRQRPENKHSDHLAGKKIE